MEDINLKYLVKCEKDEFLVEAGNHKLAMDIISYIAISDFAKFKEEYGEIKQVYCLGGLIYETR